MTADKTAAERMRRYRARKQGVTVVSIPKESYLYRKGLFLNAAFLKAWADFSNTERFRRSFPKVWFEAIQDNTRKNSPDLDFCIGVLLPDRSTTIVPVELKNWFVPQWLTPVRVWKKIGKKFVVSQLTHWVVNGLDGERGLDPHPNDRLVKLLLCTDSVQFTGESYDLMMKWGFRIERVGNIPFHHDESAPVYPKDSVPLSVWRSVESRVVEQMTEILERVFYSRETPE